MMNELELLDHLNDTVTRITEDTLLLSLLLDYIIKRPLSIRWKESAILNLFVIMRKCICCWNHTPVLSAFTVFTGA